MATRSARKSSIKLSGRPPAAESAGARIIVIGWRGMSQLCRMTPKNCKINTQRLIRKLALEVLSPYNTPESIGTTYRIFPSEAILCRRRAAGLEWVVRSRGVEFVDPSTATGIRGNPIAAHLCGYASELLKIGQRLHHRISRVHNAEPRDQPRHEAES
jgi:hypothetical protein